MSVGAIFASASAVLTGSMVRSRIGRASSPNSAFRIDVSNRAIARSQVDSNGLRHMSSLYWRAHSLFCTHYMRLQTGIPGLFRNDSKEELPMNRIENFSDYARLWRMIYTVNQ